MEKKPQKTSAQRHKTEHKPLWVPGILSWSWTGQQKGSWTSHLEAPQSWADETKPLQLCQGFPAGNCKFLQGAAPTPKALKFRRICRTEHSYSPWDEFVLKWKVKLKPFYDNFFSLKRKISAHLPDLFESLEATQRNGSCMCRHVPSNRNTSFHSTLFIPVPPSSQEHPAHGKEEILKFF